MCWARSRTTSNLATASAPSRAAANPARGGGPASEGRRRRAWAIEVRPLPTAPAGVTSRKYVFDVTSVGQRSLPWPRKLGEIHLTTDSKSRWSHGKKAYFRGVPTNRPGWHYGNTYLTSFPLVSLRCLGHVNSRYDFIPRASSVFLSLDLRYASRRLMNLWKVPLNPSLCGNGWLKIEVTARKIRVLLNLFGSSFLRPGYNICGRPIAAWGTKRVDARKLVRLSASIQSFTYPSIHSFIFLSVNLFLFSFLCFFLFLSFFFLSFLLSSFVSFFLSFFLSSFLSFRFVSFNRAFQNRMPRRPQFLPFASRLTGPPLVTAVGGGGAELGREVGEDGLPPALWTQRPRWERGVQVGSGHERKSSRRAVVWRGVWVRLQLPRLRLKHGALQPGRVGVRAGAGHGRGACWRRYAYHCCAVSSAGERRWAVQPKRPAEGPRHGAALTWFGGWWFLIRIVWLGLA